jgi:hypothetical protein
MNRIVLDRFGVPPLRVGEGLHLRQGVGRHRAFVCFIIGAYGHPVHVSGPHATRRTLANARAIADRRFCAERRA